MAQVAFKNWFKLEWVGMGTNVLGKNGMGMSCYNGSGSANEVMRMGLAFHSHAHI